LIETSEGKLGKQEQKRKKEGKFERLRNVKSGWNYRSEIGLKMIFWLFSSVCDGVSHISCYSRAIPFSKAQDN
jgi:hypothetical protein